jgi:hypothetical protein
MMSYWLLKKLTKAIVISLGLDGIGLIEFRAMISKNDKKTKTFNATLHEDNDDWMGLAKMEPKLYDPALHTHL